MTKVFGKPFRRVRIAGSNAASSLRDLVLPPTCRFCNAPVSDTDFCPACTAALNRDEPTMRLACRRCGVPGPSRPVTAESTAIDPAAALERCVHCRDQDFGFESVTALWPYRDQVCDAVVAAKYAHQSPLADAMGRRLGARIAEVSPATVPDLVTFVSSHLTRQLSRGGNGGETIARAVATRLGISCRSLIRATRRIAKQAWLDDRQRQENVRGAFAAKRSYAFVGTSGITDRHILLVDDVLTTGATANEVARVLRELGAAKVTLAVVARALPT